jgi:FMN reductase
MKVVAISGATRRPSKTSALLQALLTASVPLGADVAFYDLLDVGLSFGAAVGRGDLQASARHVLEAVEGADGLVVGSPVYKGAYTGQFKHFFDLVDPTALQGKPVSIAATGGGHRHALVVEQSLRPLFGFFGALTIPTAVYAAESDFVGYEPNDVALLERISRAGNEFRTILAALTKPQDIRYAS